MRWKAFWIEPVDQERVWLRRYAGDTKCSTRTGCHDAMVFLKDRSTINLKSLDHPDDPDRPPKDSPLWPQQCACGYVFTESDHRQVFDWQLYRGAPDGKLYTLRDVPPGAMWNAEWLSKFEWATGADGISLHVKLPNDHDWNVDQEASNCTRTQWTPVPGEPNTRHWGGRTHYCWVRKGDPKTGDVHVDKAGNTCAAGAGSIQSGQWHGYLHNGWLKDDAG